MALFNEILTARHNRQLTKLFGMKGPAPSPVLAPEVMPTYNIEEFDRAELYFLRGEKLLAASQEDTAAGANVLNFQLINPAGSGIIATVEEIVFFSVSAGNPRWFLTFSKTQMPAVTTSWLAYPRESRWDPSQAGAGGGSCLVLSKNDSPADLRGAELARFYTIQLTAYILKGPWVLDSSNGAAASLLLSTLLLTQQAVVNWKWRERPIDSGEGRV